MLKKVLLATVVYCCMQTVSKADSPAAVTYTAGKLANGIISVEFDLRQGGFSIKDAKSKEILLSDARFRLPSGEPPANVKVLKVENIQDNLGRGKRIILSAMDWNLLRYGSWQASGREPALQLFTYTLYESNPALVLGFGLKTRNYISMRISGSRPIDSAKLFGGRKLENLKTLNGAAGAEPTLVKSDADRVSANSLMLTALVDGQRRSVVWGGLKYAEFAKISILHNGAISSVFEDPVGRLVDEGRTYIADDTIYLDVYTHEPFEALERYGKAMQKANNAKPNVCDFPVLCGWSVGNVSHLPDVNNSVKLIEQLDYANKCGLTKYTKVALRLEPDKYHFDTEQGWWDDEHMQKFGHLKAPYDTIEKWSKALEAKNGIAYIYMQLGMPSDDFVRQFPEYMLFNDNSEIDRHTPGLKNGKKHPHHQPYVTFDYTDKGFSEHFVNAWSKLHRDGIQGVKVDYPGSAWRPEGGFDDRYATCNSAYRRAFELLRKGMSKEGLIDERNLGESGRPCLDMTAGVIDTQRVWSDSNKFMPEMISRSGLRWYKNRTVFNYYSDTKAVHGLPKRILESLITMNFITSGRLDLATSFSFFNPEITHIVSRSYPNYRELKTARPLDAFIGIRDPQVYDLELTPDWHQIIFYNTGKSESEISTAVSGERVSNAIGLDAAGEYHAYEFWHDTYLGKLQGTDRVKLTLAPKCCAMISLRKAEEHPQVLSTDRHLLQGWMDLNDVKWSPAQKRLSGTAKVIGGEPFTITIACNGYKALKAVQPGAELKPHPNNTLIRLELNAEHSGDQPWTVSFK